MLQDFFLKNQFGPILKKIEQTLYPQLGWTGPYCQSPIKNHKGTKVTPPPCQIRLKLLTIYIVNQTILRLKRQGSRRWGRSTPTWLDGLILSKSPSGKSGLLPRKRVASLTPSGPGSTRSKRGSLKKSTMAMINPSTIIYTG